MLHLLVLHFAFLCGQRTSVQIKNGIFHLVQSLGEREVGILHGDHNIGSWQARLA